MNATVIFWAGAWLNFTLLFVLAVLAIRSVRAGDAQTHRRYMITASLLVLLFMASYVVKLMVLGRENMAVWSARDVNVLRFHETCVLVMMLGGGLSLWIGRKLRKTRSFTRQREDAVPSSGLVRTHRIAGRVAVIGAGLGWISAFFVLVGMVQRADESIAVSPASAQHALLSGGEAADPR